MKIVPYYPITDENMKRIVRLKLERIVKRMQENLDVDSFTMTLWWMPSPAAAPTWILVPAMRTTS
jgi:hypothetical protein